MTRSAGRGAIREANQRPDVQSPPARAQGRHPVAEHPRPGPDERRHDRDPRGPALARGASRREAARRSQSSNNMKQIAWRAQLRRRTQGAFARPISTKNGKPLFELARPNPAVPRAAELYEQFASTSRGTSAHNKKLIPQMPSCIRTRRPAARDGPLPGIAGKGLFFDGAKGGPSPTSRRHVEHDHGRRSRPQPRGDLDQADDWEYKAAKPLDASARRTRAGSTRSLPTVPCDSSR